MNSRPWLVLSLAANLALGALVYRAFQAHPLPAAPLPAQRKAAPVSTVALNQTSLAGPAITAPADLAFDWSQLASADFKRYRDNLRASGCPEPTMRLIITAEIEDQFARRRRDLLDDVQRRFWDLLAKRVAAGRGDVFEDGDWKVPLKKLREEREALLADVLGAEKPDRAANLETRQAFYQASYAWLPPEKRDRLAALETARDTSRQATWDAINARSDRTPTGAEKSQMAAADKDFADARDQLLSSEEQQELKLRQSNAARWAENLSGFEATEQEWRAVATAQNTFDESGDGLKNNPDRAARWSEMHDELQQEIAASLGPDRYAEYKLAQNGDYQQTRRITRRYQLPEESARQAYELEQSAEGAARKLNDDSTLDAGARQAALAALRQEAEQSLSATLGPEVFATYQKYHGTWLDRMTTTAH